VTYTSRSEFYLFNYIRKCLQIIATMTETENSNMAAQAEIEIAAAIWLPKPTFCELVLFIF